MDVVREEGEKDGASSCPQGSEEEEEGWRFHRRETVKFCQYFITRKRRQCSHRVAANSESFCSEHSPEALMESRAADIQARTRHACRELLEELVAEVCGEDTDHDDYAELKKKNNKNRKMRVSAPKRMANPFSVDLTPSISNITAEDMFSDHELPLHIDIGCARGRCIERLSKRPERLNWNHLGIEIRPRTVEEASDKVKGAKIKNLHFLTCNFAASARELLTKFPKSSIRLISIQFPDPWKRKKHMRRLLVQKKLVNELAMLLPQGAVIYLSSDCDNVADWMAEKFLQCDEDGDESYPGRKSFRLINSIEDLKAVGHPNAFLGLQKFNSEMDEKATSCSLEEKDVAWLDSRVNPLGELSERELVCEVDWRNVRRCCFVKL